MSLPITTPTIYYRQYNPPLILCLNAVSHEEWSLGLHETHKRSHEHTALSSHPKTTASNQNPLSKEPSLTRHSQHLLPALLAGGSHSTQRHCSGMTSQERHGVAALDGDGHSAGQLLQDSSFRP
jgi:hypothetical protein